MAVNPPVENLQTIEVGVSGPDGANRLFVTTGLAQASHGISASGFRDSRQNFSLLIPPALTTGQFRRAIATVSLSALSTADWNTSATDQLMWEIEDVDADYDDESGQVELRFTLYVSARDAQVSVLGVSFSVTTLAEVV